MGVGASVIGLGVGVLAALGLKALAREMAGCAVTIRLVDRHIETAIANCIPAVCEPPAVTEL